MAETPSSPVSPPSHFIGVGASAGGLEALQAFFKPLPANTGTAFIVVQHLSPDFKSMMPELLSKSTSMPIYQVTDGTFIEANCVYLMPARKNMLIGEGKLLISDQMPDTGSPHMPIDIFFRSLAEDQQHKAIGIILSGTGSDGTRGIKAMKESGGLVIVQEPGSASFDGMPISARNTGLADMLLPPEEMAASILNSIKHPSITGESSILKGPIAGSEDTLPEIFQMLKHHSSINFSQYKASTVARRIERRLGINQLTTLESYLRLLIDSPREVQILSKELLIGVTHFFRDDESFKRIETDVIPKIVEKAKHNKDGIRLWIAGCSSGEEAYSFAMLCDEALNRRKIQCKINIFATDVDEDAISEASEGLYSSDIEQDVSPERLKKYFVNKDGQYQVTRKLRQMIIFASHNMIEDPPFSNIDLVSCRNVLIYFQHAAQKKVLSSLYFALRRDGFLFLGSSESLGDLQSHFEVVDTRTRLFKKISNVRVPLSNPPPSRDVLNSGKNSMAMAPVSTLFKPSRLSTNNHQISIMERILHQYSPNCIVLNEAFEAIHVYGDISKYVTGVKAGKISNNIKDMVVDDLSVAVSTALYRCEKNEEDVFYQDVAIAGKDDTHTTIDISIFNIKQKEAGLSPRYYVLQFIEKNDGESIPNTSPKITFDASEQARQRIDDLERELVKKQEHLQVTIEELETTNEELQSANEELMSANEELQSTNEEMQSVNEELYTVNSEYQEKIVELTEVNDDLDSVINATEIGIIFLDEQLTIRKFTPPSTSYINLREADIGRPFHHISHSLIYDNFLTDIANVSTTGDSIDKNINSLEEHALLLRIIPHKSVHDNTQSGVVITITNISRLRFVESALKKAQEQLRSSLIHRSEKLHGRIQREDTVNILLLDDDSVDRKRVSKLLQNMASREFNITLCSEIKEAVDIASKGDFDIFLVDYQLAGGTAKDFIDQVKNKNIDAPVIILSAYSEMGLDSDFLNTDIFDFLNKDELSGQLLIRSIDYVLERRDVQHVLEDLST